MKKFNIGWGLTNLCNMNCKFCYSKETREKSRECNIEDWKKFIDENYEQIDSINYGTGENAKKLGIKFWNKPSNSCLATRFPYDSTLSKEDLIKVDKGEELLKNLGIQKVRLRSHKDIARIEINREDFNTVIGNKEIVEKIKELGYKYVTLDLDGIKSGAFDK